MNPIKVSLDRRMYSFKPKDVEVGQISNRIAKNSIFLNAANIKLFVENVGAHGQTFSPATFKNGSRKKENFEQMQLLVLDIDHNISTTEVFERAKQYDLPIFFAYDILSSIDHDRFRVVFKNDVSISDAKAAEIYQNALLTMFPEADQSSKDISKMYYGGKELLTFDESVPEINLEFLIRNMTCWLRDKYGDTNYKRKIAEFAKNNGIALNGNNLLDISVSEYIAKIPATETVGANGINKISPNPIIISKIANGENLLNYKINLDDGCTNNLSVAKSKKINHGSRPSSFLIGISSSCQLFREFETKNIELHHDELFGIATNLIQIESGKDKFLDIVKKNHHYASEYNYWNYNLSYIKQSNYSPKGCSGFCRYKDKCNHGSNILSTTKPEKHTVEKLANCEEKYYPINKVVENVRQKLHTAVDAKNNGIYVIKAQTSVGKSTAFIELMKEDQGQNFLIAASSNKLKDELYERAVSEGIEITKTPSLHQLELPDDVMGHIDKLYETGRYRQVNPYIDKIIAEGDKNCTAQLKDYQKEMCKFQNSSCNAITTHKRLLNMTDRNLKKYDNIIVDEDIILKSIIPNQCIIPISELEKLCKKIDSNTPLAKKIRRTLKLIKTESFFTMPSIAWDDEDEDDGISKKIDIPSFCSAEKFYYRKPSDEKNLFGDSGSNDSLIFYRPVKLLKSQSKLIIASATANESIYEYFFCEDRVKFFDCKKATYQGTLNQYTAQTMSRTCIDKDRSVFDRIGNMTGIDKVITFKKYSKGPLYFGNTEGLNIYEGKNINVIGTPHQPEWIYKLFAYTLGLDFDLDAKLKSTVVTHNGYKFPFTTYDDEVLRNIQFWIVESDLEQAVGRARLLRYDCIVNLFSNFPLSQAIIYDSKY